MINRTELLEKIDAALRICPQSAHESIAYPIIKELRNNHVGSLETIFVQEKEKSEIDMKNFLLIKSIAEQMYSEKTTMEITLIIINVRVQLRRITGLPPLAVDQP